MIIEYLLLHRAIVELMRACETYRDGDGVSQVIERLNRAQDDFKKVLFVIFSVKIWILLHVQLSEKLTVERPDENDDDDDDENADITTDINNDLKNERQTSAVSWDIVDEENRPSPSPSRSVRDRLSSRAKSTSPDDKSLQLYRKMVWKWCEMMKEELYTYTVQAVLYVAYNERDCLWREKLLLERDCY